MKFVRGRERLSYVFNSFDVLLVEFAFGFGADTRHFSDGQRIKK